ncbi:hypothetical protein FOA52_013861 [Chlamydomonas sp. UWO 241]|nr:hypothetical protein FOA52_013861 [Chlamydomonas sp. UWO 241]
MARTGVKIAPGSTAGPSTSLGEESGGRGGGGRVCHGEEEDEDGLPASYSAWASTYGAVPGMGGDGLVSSEDLPTDGIDDDGDDDYGELLGSEALEGLSDGSEDVGGGGGSGSQSPSPGGSGRPRSTGGSGDVEECPVDEDELATDDSEGAAAPTAAAAAAAAGGDVDDDAALNAVLGLYSRYDSAVAQAERTLAQVRGILGASGGGGASTSGGGGGRASAGAGPSGGGGGDDEEYLGDDLGSDLSGLGDDDDDGVPLDDDEFPLDDDDDGGGGGGPAGDGEEGRGVGGGICARGAAAAGRGARAPSGGGAVDAAAAEKAAAVAAVAASIVLRPGEVAVPGSRLAALMNAVEQNRAMQGSLVGVMQKVEALVDRNWRDSEAVARLPDSRARVNEPSLGSTRLNMSVIAHSQDAAQRGAGGGAGGGQQAGAGPSAQQQQQHQQQERRRQHLHTAGSRFWRIGGITPAPNADTLALAAAMEVLPSSFERTRWSPAMIERLKSGVLTEVQHVLTADALQALQAVPGQATQAALDTEFAAIRAVTLSSDEAMRVVASFTQEHWGRISRSFVKSHGATDCVIFYMHSVAPGRARAWGQDESARLRALAEKHGGRHWEKVASELGTFRTPSQCMQFYLKHCRAARCGGGNVEHLKYRTNWTPADDATLRVLVTRHGTQWVKIALEMGDGFDRHRVRDRWHGQLKPTAANDGLAAGTAGVVTQRKTGKWDPAEDTALLAAVARHGRTSWPLVAAAVGTRTAQQCRERYNNCLDPEIDASPFTTEQEATLRATCTAHLAAHGRIIWANVAKAFTGRTDELVRRAWKSMCKYGQTRLSIGTSHRRSPGKAAAAKAAAAPRPGSLRLPQAAGSDGDDAADAAAAAAAAGGSGGSGPAAPADPPASAVMTALEAGAAALALAQQVAVRERKSAAAAGAGAGGGSGGGGGRKGAAAGCGRGKQKWAPDDTDDDDAGAAAKRRQTQTGGSGGKRRQAAAGGGGGKRKGAAGSSSVQDAPDSNGDHVGNRVGGGDGGAEVFEPVEAAAAELPESLHGRKRHKPAWQQEYAE